MRALLAAVGVALFLTVGSAQAQRDAKPQVRLVDAAPVTLRGVGFDPVESVRLVVKIGDRIVGRKLKATRTGSFTSTYPAMRYNRCSGSLDVRATGGRGSRVSWELIPFDCPVTADT